MTASLTGLGIWSMDLRYGNVDHIADAAAELESLGYTALWAPDVGGRLLDSIDLLLDATSTVTIATGILNVWLHTPDEVMAWWQDLSQQHRSRVLLGLGISHGPVIGERYARPLATMTDYLDALESAGMPLAQVCLAALGPKMLDLAASRTAGALPYLVPPEHTATARRALDDKLLCVEQGVVLDTDRERALAVAAPVVAGYGNMPNYARNWQRLGYTADDIAGPSERLIDALIAVGDVEDIAGRIAAQRAAGADHVCIQVLTAPGSPFPLEAWRRLAPNA